MRSNIIISMWVLVIASVGHAQIDIGGKLKALPGNVNTSAAIGKFKGAFLDKLAEDRKEYDEASFNYAVSLADNTGLFESEERYRKHQKLLLEVVKKGSQEQNSNTEKAANLNDAGEMLYASGKFKLAELSFRQAQVILLQEGDTLNGSYAQVISNLGLIYHSTGRYILSEVFTQRALDLRKTIFKEGNPSIAASLNNLGVLYKDMGRYQESEDLMKKAIASNEKDPGKNSVPYAITLNNYAMLLQVMGRLKEAEPILKNAIDVAGLTLKEKSANYVRLLTNQAFLYQEMKKYPESESIYKKAIEIKERRFGTSHPDYAHLLNNLASLYMELNRLTEVEDLLKRSVNIYKKSYGEQHPAYASAISNLGNFYRVTDRVTEAHPLLETTVQIRLSTLGEDHPDYISAIENYGLLLWQENKILEASANLIKVQEKNLSMIQKVFAPLSESEKEKFWDKMRPKFQRFNSFALNNYKLNPELITRMYNYQLETKAILLSSSDKVRSTILNGNDQQLKKEYLKWLDEKENLARLYTYSKAELEDEKINLDSLERAANDREKSLSLKSGVFSGQFEKVKVDNTKIFQSLSNGEATVEIIQTRKFTTHFLDSVLYVALIITKEGGEKPQVVIFNNGNQLEKRYYSYYKNSIRQQSKDEISYKQFWEPLELSLSSSKTIYFSADGIFNQINLNTILLPKGNYVIDEKQIILVTNTKHVPELKISMNAAPRINRNITLIGSPDFGNAGSISALPGTEAEVQKIKQVIGTGYNLKVLLKQEAKEETVKSENNPKILHIATHGYFIPDQPGNDEKVFGIEPVKAEEQPMLRSGLMLAGAERAIEGQSQTGILTAYEAMNMQLDRTDLVVLSACETGLGDVKNGEGVYGLQRAFQIAGVDCLVMSLWKVNDQSTSELMTAFYKYYIASGDKHASFRRAQLEIKAKYKNPYYWGPFIMVE